MNAPANLTTALTRLPSSPTALVRYAARGSSDQAIARIPRVAPFLRQIRQLQTSPRADTATQIAPPMLLQTLMTASPRGGAAVRAAQGVPISILAYPPDSPDHRQHAPEPSADPP